MKYRRKQLAILVSLIGAGASLTDAACANDVEPLAASASAELAHRTGTPSNGFAADSRAEHPASVYERRSDVEPMTAWATIGSVDGPPGERSVVSIRGTNVAGQAPRESAPDAPHPGDDEPVAPPLFRIHSDSGKRDEAEAPSLSLVMSGPPPDGEDDEAMAQAAASSKPAESTGLATVAFAVGTPIPLPDLPTVSTQSQKLMQELAQVLGVDVGHVDIAVGDGVDPAEAIPASASSIEAGSVQSSQSDRVWASLSKILSDTDANASSADGGHLPATSIDRSSALISDQQTAASDPLDQLIHLDLELPRAVNVDLFGGLRLESDLAQLAQGLSRNVAGVSLAASNTAAAARVDALAGQAVSAEVSAGHIDIEPVLAVTVGDDDVMHIAVEPASAARSIRAAITRPAHVDFDVAPALSLRIDANDTMHIAVEPPSTYEAAPESGSEPMHVDLDPLVAIGVDASDTMHIAIEPPPIPAAVLARTAVHETDGAGVVAIEPVPRDLAAKVDTDARLPRRSPLGGEVVAMSQDRLDDVRGGFTTGNGLNISFGIERAVRINGNLVTSTSLNLSDLGKITAGGTGPVNIDAGSIALIQSGTGNTFSPGAVTGSAIGTIVQNTLNDQKIQNVTVINATVNSLDVLKGLNLQSSLRGAITDSLRR